MEHREINGIDFTIVYGETLGSPVAKVFKEGEFCFDMYGEYDTDTENEYIRCWIELEDC